LSSKGKKNYKLWDFTGYQILGDDLVIVDKSTGEKYQEILGKFDVNINLAKSFLSTYHCGEFTKRLFWMNQEISPLPISMFQAINESLYNVPQFLESVIERWGIPAVLAELWALEPGVFTKKVKLLELLISFRELINGRSRYPFCMWDRSSVLEGLKAYIIPKILTSSININRPTGKGALHQSLMEMFKSTGIAVPASLAKEEMMMFYHPLPWALTKSMTRTIEAKQALVDLVQQDEDTSPTWMTFRSIKSINIDLFFLKTKRRRTRQITSLMLDFINKIQSRDYKV